MSQQTCGCGRLALKPRAQTPRLQASQRQDHAGRRFHERMKEAKPKRMAKRVF